jgi:hypothetical protein
MHVRIASDEARKLVAALQRAGTREIGGQLFGEQLEPSHFRVTELTIQRRAGTFARFVVDLVQAARDAVRFFQRTRHDYQRFNYVGEWHSHPSFEVAPSPTDADTMRDLVRDPEFKGTFALLMIVRWDSGELRSGAWVFDPNGPELEARLEIEA